MCMQYIKISMSMFNDCPYNFHGLCGIHNKINPCIMIQAGFFFLI